MFITGGPLAARLLSSGPRSIYAYLHKEVLSKVPVLNIPTDHLPDLVVQSFFLCLVKVDPNQEGCVPTAHRQHRLRRGNFRVLLRCLR